MASFLLASSCVVSFFDLFLLLTPEKQNHLINKMAFISFFLKETHGIWLTHLPLEVQCLQLSLSLFQRLYHTFVSAFLCGNQPPRCPVVCKHSNPNQFKSKVLFLAQINPSHGRIYVFAVKRLLTEHEHKPVVRSDLHTEVQRLVCFPWRIEPWTKKTNPAGRTTRSLSSYERLEQKSASSYTEVSLFISATI